VNKTAAIKCRTIR